MRRLLMLGLLVVGLLLLVAAPAFAQDGTETTDGPDAVEVVVTVAAASLVVEKIIQALKGAFGFLKGSLISVVAIGLGFAAAYGFELTVGAGGSEFIDKAFAALTVFAGSSLIFEKTDA